MNKQKAFLLLASLTLIIWFRQPLSELLSIISDQKAVSQYLQSFGALGPIVLFTLMVAQVFIAIIPGHALMVTAGYVYGNLGLFIVITSTVLGSQIAFLIARYYGQELINKLAAPDVISKWHKVAQRQGILFYFFAFVLPIFPSDLMCYVAGLATISPKRFLIANILGRTCCAIFITFIGIYGMHPPVAFWVAALVIIILFFASWFVYKRTAVCQSTSTVN